MTPLGVVIYDLTRDAAELHLTTEQEQQGVPQRSPAAFYVGNQGCSRNSPFVLLLLVV